MSMATLTECRERYAVEKGFRGKIYLIAYLVTVFNWAMWYLMAVVKPLGVIGLIVGFAAIIGLYYISSGITTFIAIACHLAVVIADLATALAFCVPGIGILLGWAIGIMAGLAVFVYGAVFLYFLPFIMIPLVGFLGRHFL